MSERPEQEKEKPVKPLDGRLAVPVTEEGGLSNVMPVGHHAHFPPRGPEPL
jgi:hypothetical protein